MSNDSKLAPIRKGLLEFLVLKIVGSRSAYVPDILRRLADTEFATQEGTLYPLLSKLRREDLVQYEWQESDGARRKALPTHGRRRRRNLHRSTSTEPINRTSLKSDNIEPCNAYITATLNRSTHQFEALHAWNRLQRHRALPVADQGPRFSGSGTGDRGPVRSASSRAQVPSLAQLHLRSEIGPVQIPEVRQWFGSGESRYSARTLQQSAKVRNHGVCADSRVSGWTRRCCACGDRKVDSVRRHDGLVYVSSCRCCPTPPLSARCASAQDSGQTRQFIEYGVQNSAL
jgi:PadR family transcriptional regulator PadR